MYIYDNISLSSSYNEKCFRQKLYRKFKKKKNIVSSVIFFPKIVSFMR